MKLEILTTFKDGRDIYHQGDLRTVEDADAQRFCAAGWAVAMGGKPAPAGTEPVTLQVQGVTHATEERKHG